MDYYFTMPSFLKNICQKYKKEYLHTYFKAFFVMIFTFLNREEAVFIQEHRGCHEKTV